MKYLEQYNIKQPDTKRLKIENNFLAKNSAILPGSEIFEIMMFGTKFVDLNIKTQEEITYSLNSHYESDISKNFSNVITEIANQRRDSSGRSYIEDWFDIIKKVVRLQRHS